MKKLLGILSIVTSLFIILSIVWDISFTSKIVDIFVLVVFVSSTTLYLALVSQSFRTQAPLLFLVLIVFAIPCYFIWLFFGYKSRIDKEWNMEHYNIQLQHRLEIAGPGTFWFLINRRFLNGLLEKRVDTRRYEAEIPDPPKTFTFVNSGDTLDILCCENNVKVLTDTIAYKEYLKSIKSDKNE